MLNVLLFVGTYISGFLLTFFTAYPAFAFVLYEAVYFFNPNDRWWSYMIPSASYSFFTVMLMFVAYGMKILRKQPSNRVLAVPQFKYVYLLFVFYAVALSYAVLPVFHQVALINYLKLIIIITVAYKLVDTVRQFDFALWGYIFGAWYISFLTYQTGRNMGDRVEGIGTVDSPDSNGIAAAIAPCIVLSFYYFWVSKPKFRKFLFITSGVFVANAIILINSRASFLAVAISMMYFMFFIYFSPQQRKHQKLVAVLISILGLSGTLYLIDDSFLHRVSTMKNVEIDEEQETGATRIMFWLSAIEMSKDYPLGQGWRGFDFRAPEYIPQDLDTGASRNRSVHSSWFEVLTEIGYHGFIVFLLMLFTCFRITRKCRKLLEKENDYEGYFRIVAIESALLAYIVAMSFMNRFRAEVLYWLITYTMCAYNIYILKHQSRADKPVSDSALKRSQIHQVFVKDD